jgi:5-methylthioadenosine/S-adenosylhomocysteine deaminase
VADVVLLDSKNPQLQPLRADNLLSNIVYSVDGSSVDLVLVNGRLIYEKSRDYYALRERAVRLGKEINEFIGRFLP